MPKTIKNMGASVRARLQTLSRANGQSFELGQGGLTHTKESPEYSGGFSIEYLPGYVSGF